MRKHEGRIPERFLTFQTGRYSQATYTGCNLVASECPLTSFIKPAIERECQPHRDNVCSLVAI